MSLSDKEEEEELVVTAEGSARCSAPALRCSGLGFGPGSVGWRGNLQLPGSTLEGTC